MHFFNCATFLCENASQVSLVLDEKLFDFLLDGCNLWFDLRSFVLCDGGRDHRAGNATGSSKSLLGPVETIDNLTKEF